MNQFAISNALSHQFFKVQSLFAILEVGVGVGWEEVRDGGGGWGEVRDGGRRVKI